jgi:2'-5' RNA ligase
VRPKRLFVSLDLPATVADSLVRLDPHLRGARWLAADKMHLTLGFFGNVAAEAEAKLHESLRAIRFTAFFLPLCGLGVFPARGRPRIIWIGVGAGHPHLFQLRKRVNDAAVAVGLAADLRPWHPHITLARCQDVAAEVVRPFLRARAKFDLGLVRIDSFHLKSSLLTPAGSIYRTELSVSASSPG